MGILVIAAVVNQPPNAYAEASPLPEYVVKAALLYNIAKFTTWPAETFADAAAPMTLCILGTDPFGEAFRGRTVRGREVVTTSWARDANPAACHILFIRQSEQQYLPQIFDSLKNVPVLTIGDMQKFAHAGGIVNLIMVGNKVRFEINLNAAQHANLKLSSKLLKLAQIVPGKRPGEKP